MHIPEKIPGRRLLLSVTAVYMAIWIVLEGHPARVSVLAVMLLLVAALGLAQRYLAGRSLSLWRWLALCAGAGVLSGPTSTLLTLVLMALKSGLHAHGPEFTPAQIEQVLWRTPHWTVSGMLIGLALGLLLAGVSRRD